MPSTPRDPRSRRPASGRVRARPFGTALLVTILASLLAGAAPASGAPRPAVPVLSHGPTAHRVVALTFDDGWSSAATLRILAILRKQQVAATFFPYGIEVRKAASVWRRVAAAGYPIGNHTWSHPDLSTWSEKATLSQLERERAIVESVTGVPSLRLMRPPYGAWTQATAAAARDAGYQALALWDVDTLDWRGATAATIAHRAETGHNGSIILMHAGPAATVEALPGIIDWYRAHGYRFVTVPELLGTGEPFARAVPATGVPWWCHVWACPW